jgi:hypothetical protein
MSGRQFCLRGMEPFTDNYQVVASIEDGMLRVDRSLT